MIVFGTRVKLLGTKPTTETCNNCGTQHSVQLSIFQKYAHVFWIPFFPLGKIAVSECNHCKQALRTNEFPPSTRLAYDNLKRESKTPLWMFSGLALVAVFVIFTSYESKQNHKKNAALIEAPAKGDLFEVKTQDNQ